MVCIPHTLEKLTQQSVNVTEDKCQNRAFLIDTGSSLSILPYEPNLTPFLRPTVVRLTGASGAPIQCSREVDADLGIQFIRHSFPWFFVVADVMYPILGTDFLTLHAITIECKNKMHFDPSTQNHIPLNTTDAPVSTYFIDFHNVDTRLSSTVPCINVTFVIISSKYY